jgi:ketosteroid isomerase-like protein
MGSRSLEERLQVLEDVEAIKKLKARYTLAVDARDAEGVVSLFTADGVWDGGSFGRYEGKDAVRSFFRSVPERLSFFVHYVSNPLIEIDGDRATGSWYLLEPCTFAEGNQPVWGSARYEERYRRVGGEWKFEEMRLVSLFWTPYEEGWVKKRFIQES